VADEQVGDSRAGVLRADELVVAGDEAAGRRAVLHVTLDAAVASAVEVAVLPVAYVAAELKCVPAMYDRHGIREGEIVRREVDRAAVADELQALIVALVYADQYLSLARAADVDLVEAGLSRDLRVEAERAVDAGVVDA